MVILLFWLLMVLAIETEAADYLVVEGELPGQYVDPLRKNSYVHGAVVVHLTGENSGQIASIEIDPVRIADLKQSAGTQYLAAHRHGQWDVIYPGLIDLHNHTKQNNLGVWDHAHGQFANRFEWRAWSTYKKSVSNNLNPWIDYGKPIACAAFRWSEIQALSVGTTYLQGPSSCVTNFAIHQVESSEAFKTGKDRVQAPTDLVIPTDMVYVWNTLGPEIRKIQQENPPDSESYRLAYETALANNINHHCDFSAPAVLALRSEQGLGPITPLSANTINDEALDTVTDKKLLEMACTKNLPLPTKFIRYIHWVHKSIASKKKYADEIAKGRGSAIIAHLGEGRRDDKYNQIEFAMVKLLGLDRKHVNFVHGVGINDEGLQTMVDKQMGLIWSPFSNLLLYNQTLDIAKALGIRGRDSDRQGVLVALGSDWLPTGSKGPLEELKIARDYVIANDLQQSLLQMPDTDSFDEALYKMVTENPAKMINQWQNGADGSIWQNGSSSGGVGTLVEGAMGSFIVTSQLASNPFTNLVAHVWETDINLVVVDGRIQYGNSEYLQQVVGDNFEVIANGEPDFPFMHGQEVPVLQKLINQPSSAEKSAFLETLGKLLTATNQGIRDTMVCNFSGTKGFVWQNTFAQEPELADFARVTGLNLDRFGDIQRLLAINLLTQSRNRNDQELGDPDFQVTRFTPLLTCNDDHHYLRIVDFVGKTLPEDTKQRARRISEEGHGTGPERLAEKFQ